MLGKVDFLVKMQWTENPFQNKFPYYNYFIFLLYCSENQYIVTCQAHPVLAKIRRSKCAVRPFGPSVDGPKDPWPRVLSLPGRFVGDPASLARDNIYIFLL